MGDFKKPIELGMGVASHTFGDFSLKPFFVGVKISIFK
jgi:hypothetical protein